MFLNTITLEDPIKSRRASAKPYALALLDLAKTFNSVLHNSIERTLTLTMEAHSKATTKSSVSP